MYFLPVLCALLAVAAPADLKSPLATLRAVGPDGKGSAEAARAWREVAGADVGQLPEVLAAMDGASPLARNWLRSAIENILDHAAGKALPAAALEALLLDPRHDPQARRLAYELIVQGDKDAPARYLPKLLDDPNRDLRHDAIARLLKQADTASAAGQKAEALPLYRRCLAAAREKDQLDRTARKLRDLGDTVDLPALLGLVPTWKVIGPFPNNDQKGMTTAYPPEKQIDLSAEYDGKVRWKDYTTKDEYGLVDLNAALGDQPVAIGYALAEVTSGAAHDVEVRLGCFTAFKLWVNGEMVLERGDAYTGMELDHYVARVHLKEGRNTILVKAGRETPPPPVPNHWRFQLRICDAGGAALTDVGATQPK